jgi:hypothetical protein
VAVVEEVDPPVVPPHEGSGGLPGWDFIEGTREGPRRPECQRLLPFLRAKFEPRRGNEARQRPRSCRASPIYVG